MNFDDAITAHSGWKQKLAAYLRRPDGSIDVASLAADSHCALGQWIHSQSGAITSDPRFAELKREHASFHRAAAEVVRRANAGANVSEEIALGAKSPYAECSSRVIQLIMEMKRKLAA